MQLRHICEECGAEEILTAEDAYAAGWDYPPRMGALGVISPRTCPNCPVNRTVWRAIAIDGYPADMLSEHQQAVIDRILGEPDTITVLSPAPENEGTGDQHRADNFRGDQHGRR